MRRLAALLLLAASAAAPSLRADAPAPSPSAAPSETRTEAESIVFLLQYIAGDYPAAVQNGAVANAAEYEENLGFAGEARRRLAALAGPAAAVSAARGIESRLVALQAMIEKKAPGDDVRTAADAAMRDVMDAWRIVPFPRRAPDAARGAALFAQNCATCHGATGAGDGPSAATLNPKPAPFANPEFLDTLTPYQAYNAVTQGVAGTPMASFRDAIRDDGARWDLAFHLWTFDPRGGPPPPPASVRVPLREQATRSTRAIAEELQAGRWGAKAATPEEALGWARALRRRPAPEIAAAERILLAQEGIERTWESYLAGRGEDAALWVTDLYLDEIEPLEASLDARDGGLRPDVEGALAAYRGSLRAGAGTDERRRAARESMASLLGAMDRARAALAAPPTGAPFVLSATIVLREGVEAALLLGLILAALRAARRESLRRWVHLGVVLALAAGAATWFVSESLLGGRFAGRETLEGAVSLLAAVVLTCVTFWLIRRADLAWWTSHLKSHVGGGLERGSGWALAGVAFLAVYREAFETVLFYQALALQSAGSGAAIFGGFLAGLAALVLAVAAILWLGVKVPMKAFFAATSTLLVALAVVFTGEGIHALQISGKVPMTQAWRGASAAWAGLYPTVESLSAQGALVLLFVAGLALRRRRSPAPATSAVPAAPSAPPPIPAVAVRVAATVPTLQPLDARR